MYEQPELAPIAPTTLPAVPSEIEEELDMLKEIAPIDDLDAESVVEAAELLLRAGAPHDFDVIVIGAGPSGLACSIRLARNGHRVALIERDEVGGISLNYGLTPLRVLLESVNILRLMRRAQTSGLNIHGAISLDLPQMQMHKHEIIATLRTKVEEQIGEYGVQLLQGTARLQGDCTIEIEEATGVKRRLGAVHIVIASGSSTTESAIVGANLPGVLSCDEILELKQIPHRLIICGEDAMAIETATLFAGLGSQTTLIESSNSILPGEDEDIQNAIKGFLEEAGVEVLLNTSVEKIEPINGALSITTYSHGTKRNFEAEIVLVIGERKANIHDLQLEKTNVQLENGIIRVAKDGSTDATGIWAIGSCARHNGGAHHAIIDGQNVADAISGIETYEEKNNFVPNCYYTFPEAATVGLNLKEAKAVGVEAHVGRSSFHHNGRAVISNQNIGFIKLVIETNSGKIIGAQIIGPRATELINEIATALSNGDTAEILSKNIHGHLTFGEILEDAANDTLFI